MPADRIVDEDEEYQSSQDSDFAPDDAPDAASGSSDSEDEPDEAARKRRRPVNEAKTDGGDDYENSGDEAIIEKGRKRQKRARAKGEAVDDEGGEGGLIKTRRQRAAEKEERQYALSAGPVTVDIDAIWAEMKAGGASALAQEKEEEGKAVDGTEAAVTADNAAAKDDESSMIRIKRTYNFAGRVHTEEKLVPRDSAEAKLYLASQGEDALPDSLPIKRLTKKAFRSAFEPAVEGMTGRSDLNLGVAARMKAANEAQAKKLNTVEKSRMDWAGFVDKEGIKDELELAGKSKDSYASRQDFLARSEALREVEARKARVAARV
ncbi:BCNT-domain-containing protein [Trichoderma citrinoviride]|uniref:SWR1-complex protein 5 n=1 Tax=Trichoderma citrinoviride TaxID=58853 RepID=A0A2T4B5C5_9HYPO|nr:BCNT-domain-containing protein [Trichoderma citrinoviride]PTB64411.1 BCNT-domain-containing protein [Trichoderma citrinoviride]